MSAPLDQGPAPTRRCLTPEHRHKLSIAKLGRTYSPEHRAKIAAGMRAAHARGVHPAHSYLRALSEGEREDYQVLTRVGRYRRAEALKLLGRQDLLPAF